MEGFLIPVIAFSVFIAISFLMLLSFYCLAKKFQTQAPVVVTSATHTAPGGYPVTQMPPPGYPAGNAYGAPYPAQTTGNVTVQMPMPMPHQQQHQQMPMPMQMPGMQTHGVAYPPYPGAGAANMNPPPYDMAMANPGPSVMPAGYEKQAPYNPNFGQ
ncbi:T-cell surface antigen CD2 isoform X7 [Drosophila gunungcola]|uniref:T-cell surface antigen CD2 isoform X7 n=1 Tax=Drosophila gunungcola TaxID=103775 RepID=UPI0022E6305E|nr:T-cell surface antigen CD2 isoform X7 [Drosophila gunungcola]